MKLMKRILGVFSFFFCAHAVLAQFSQASLVANLSENEIIEIIGIKHDGNGGIIIAGEFSDTFSIGGIQVLGANTKAGMSYSTPNIFVVKLNSSTGKADWARVVKLDDPDQLRSYGKRLQVDGKGNIHVLCYLGGNKTSSAKFQVQSSATKFTAIKDHGYRILKYNTSGVLVNTTPVDIRFDTKTHRMRFTVDKFGNYYVNSEFDYHALNLGKFKFRKDSSDRELYITKIDTLGNFLWAETIGGYNWHDGLGDVVCDGDSFVYLAGNFGPRLKFSFKDSMTVPGYGTVVLIKYDLSGKRIWVETTEHTGGKPMISIDSKKDVLVAGYAYARARHPRDKASVDTIRVGQIRHVNKLVSPTRVWWVAKYTKSGSVKWLEYLDMLTISGKITGSGGTDIRSVDVDQNDNVYITGSALDSVKFQNGKKIWLKQDHRYWQAFNIDGKFMAFDTFRTQPWVLGLTVDANKKIWLGMGYAKAIHFKGNNVVPKTTTKRSALVATYGPLCAWNNIAPIPNRVACLGTQIEIDAYAASNESVRYVWFKDGKLLSNVTGSKLTLSSFAKADIGSYQVIAANGCGIDTSNVFKLLEATKPTINSYSKSDTVCGNSAKHTLTVKASGYDLKYNWLFNGKSVGDKSDLEFNPVANSDTGNYKVVVMSSCLSDTSGNIHLSKTQAPSITLDLSSKDLCEGTDNALVVATSPRADNYQWIRDNSKLTNNSDSLKFLNASKSMQGNYWVEASNKCGVVKSKRATISVTTATAITTQPKASTTRCERQTAILTTAAVGESLSYQWYKDGKAINKMGKDLKLTYLNQSNTGDYTLVVTGKCGVDTSDTATITVNPKTSITQDLVATKACEGDSLKLLVRADGGGLTYTWYHNSVSQKGSNFFAIPMASLSDSGEVYVQISGNCGSATSSKVKATVYERTTISIQPTDITACEMQPLSLSFTASGHDLTYQWYKKGVAISGSTTDKWEAANGQNSDDGMYLAEVKGSCGTTKTDSVKVEVIESIGQIGIISSSNVVGCEGDSLYANAFVSAGDAVSYKWLKSASVVSSTGSLVFPKAKKSDQGAYRIVGSNQCDADTSAPVSFIVNESPRPAVSKLGLNLSVPPTFSKYQWVKDGVAISGANSATYKATGVGKYFAAVVSKDGCAGVSDTANIITIGVSETMFANVRVFPNPAANSLNVKGLEAYSGQLVIYSTEGKVVLTTQEFNNKTIDVSALKSGVYWLRLEEQTMRGIPFVKE